MSITDETFFCNQNEENMGGSATQWPVNGPKLKLS